MSYPTETGYYFVRDQPYVPGARKPRSGQVKIVFYNKDRDCVHVVDRRHIRAPKTYVWGAKVKVPKNVGSWKDGMDLDAG